MRIEIKYIIDDPDDIAALVMRGEPFIDGDVQYRPGLFFPALRSRDVVSHFRSLLDQPEFEFWDNHSRASSDEKDPSLACLYPMMRDDPDECVRVPRSLLREILDDWECFLETRQEKTISYHY